MHRCIGNCGNDQVWKLSKERAILGFHIVVSLIALTIMSKLGTRLSVIQMFIVKGLYRFIAPSNDDIRALMPPSKDNPRARKKKREEEETEGFNVPKSLPLRLRVGRVVEEELRNLPLYSSVHWLSLFVPLCLVVYSLSEVFSFLFPSNTDTNVSILWLLIAVAFVLQVLARLTSWLVMNEDERSVLLVFAAIFFLLSVIFATQADNFFDIRLLSGYDHFCNNIATLMSEAGVTDSYTRYRDPVLLYVSMSVLFSFIAAMLVFPNFRYANMYTNAQQSSSRLMKLALHITFLLPLLTLLSFTSPIKKQLVFGPRKLLTEEQLDILRVYLAILSLVFRVALKAPHLQAHLNLSSAKLKALQRETGYIRNVALQATIFRYYSYFCAVILQYFAPVLLSFFFALLLKTTGDLSWLGTSSSSVSSPPVVGSLRSIFDATVCRAIWSFSNVNGGSLSAASKSTLRGGAARDGIVAAVANLGFEATERPPPSTPTVTDFEM
ncbi:hypothetical protein Y032_0096g2921 [Ancylostoma ceylanicum]|uniref:Transmembrane protein n=1 Tax=Ancylostoma ceylanicum TaxID=53326 RepID=A0A016TK50_9BILA|nr:hypothetical protein Y032_0096g2921 [Ancylostoma ceylanicum]